MTTVLVEPNGAQVLPRVGDQRATVPAYAAWADLAARLFVRRTA